MGNKKIKFKWLFYLGRWNNSITGHQYRKQRRKRRFKGEVAGCILDLLSCLCVTPTNRYSMELNFSKVMAGVGENVITEPDIKILEVCVPVT